jgi:hypothetical protein
MNWGAVASRYFADLGRWRVILPAEIGVVMEKVIHNKLSNKRNHETLANDRLS